MKLLLDENLSRRLIPKIADLFPESVHVASLGLLQGADIWVWEYAKRNDFAIVTAARDFNELATANGHPPKIIWLRDCDSPTIDAEALIRAHVSRLLAFYSDADRSVLILPEPV